MDNQTGEPPRLGERVTRRQPRWHMPRSDGQQLGRQLLARYANDSASQTKAKEVVARVLEIAAAARSKAAEKMGTACFPGC